MNIGATDRRIAWLIFAATLLTLMLAGRTQGNTRDEGYYFDAAELYYGWYGELAENTMKLAPQRSFTRATIDRWFSYNHEHPALMKTLFGLSWRLLHRCECPSQAGRHPIAYAHRHHTLSLLGEQEAMRLPTQVSVALMVALVFLFGLQAWSRGAGLVAAVCTIGAPRLFFDAQLATFDAPIAALWMATVYAYWRSLDGGEGTDKAAARAWGWRTGVIFGLALATKHNAFFIPVMLLVHYLWIARKSLVRLRLAPFPRAFIWMAIAGPIVYLACWPWLWFDTVARFGEYLAFHLHHVYYDMEYLGVNYNKPPFPLSFPYVMTLFTLPVTTLVLALGGAAALIATAWRKTSAAPAASIPSASASTMWSPPTTDATAPGLLVGLNALFPMAILTIARQPIFGATKHWHASIPFLALLAGYGYHALVKALGGDRRRWLAIALGLLVCGPAVAETYRAHPYALTDYNMLAGGPAGGADLGLNRQFWGYSTRGLLPWINRHAAPGAPIYWHDTNQSQLNMDVREHLLRDDLRNTGLEELGVRASNLAMVIHEKHFNKYEYWIWDFYGTARPSVVLDDEGVPIVTLYERPATR